MKILDYECSYAILYAYDIHTCKYKPLGEVICALETSILPPFHFFPQIFLKEE